MPIVDLGKVVGSGVTFTPHVSEDGVLSWTNDGGLMNPDPVAIGGGGRGVQYQIGDIYITTNATSPAEIYGGTWEQIEDCFLLAAGSTYAAGSTGGEAAHTLTIAEMPNHRHAAAVIKGAETGDWWVQPPTAGSGGTQQAEYINGTSLVGGDAAHNNMPPYLAVYVWRRIA